ncbi:CD177 antigen-like [Chionomys nivalis]|uniref:CD177 antigen-like n=1 Tax=Chionomys nivalis TaxID=269649 RepID=UPI002598904F|nr:CD177 antigen-like [Chionomys nivalis]
MAACRIQYLWLLFVLGFTPFSGVLTCHKGIKIEYGSRYAEQPLEWNTAKTTIAGPQQIRQETVLIVDIGEKSVLLASKGLSNPGYYRNELILNYATGPGIVAASYYKLCSTDMCNHATSSQVLLWTLPPSGV